MVVGLLLLLLLLLLSLVGVREGMGRGRGKGRGGSVCVGCSWRGRKGWRSGRGERCHGQIGFRPMMGLMVVGVHLVRGNDRRGLRVLAQGSVEELDGSSKGLPGNGWLTGNGNNLNSWGKDGGMERRGFCSGRAMEQQGNSCTLDNFPLAGDDAPVLGSQSRVW